MRALRSLSPCLILLALASPVAAQNGAASAMRSTRDGVYSAAQAQRGKTLYGNVCAECHVLSDFRGNTFLENWAAKPVFELYDYMVSSMPEDTPGSRRPSEYADVIAYYLQLNGYPAGTADLPADPERLKAIQFERPAPAGGVGAPPTPR